MSTRYPARSVTVEFRTVFVTIEQDYSFGLSVSMHHRRANAKKPVTLRGDEAAFVDAVRALLAAGVVMPEDPS